MGRTRSGKVSRGLIVGLVTIVAAAGLIAVLLLRPDQPFIIDGQPAALELSHDDIVSLVRLKNQALAQLENDKLDDCESAFATLATKLPGRPLGARNLMVARLLKVDQIDAGRDPQKYRTAINKAAEALDLLKQSEGDAAVVHLLSGKLALKQKLMQTALTELDLAAKAAPDNPIMSYAFYLGARDRADSIYKPQLRTALERTHTLQPDNLFVLVDWLLSQAEDEDPQIKQTLTEAKTTLKPFLVKIQQLRRVDLADFINKAIAAIDTEDWSTVKRNVRIIGNLIRPETAARIDHARVDPHLLEYVIHEFDSEFHEKHNLGRTPASPAIDVKLVVADDEWQLPALSNVSDVQLADFDLNGSLDVVLIREQTVTVFGRSADAAAKTGWTALAEFKLEKKLNGLTVADLDRDIEENRNVAAAKPTDSASKPATGAGESYLVADADLIAFGADGIVILQNKLDRESGGRSLEVVPQGEGFAALREVRTVAVADLEHDGDLDLAVSSKSGITLWANRGNLTFQNISDQSALPESGQPATVLLPVDWNRNVDVDLLVAGPSMPKPPVLENIRHGRFRSREFEKEFDKLKNSSALALVDVDGNASWDLLSCGKYGIALTRTRNPESNVVRFLDSAGVTETSADGMTTWDYDNDGYQDILAWSDSAIQILHGRPGGQFKIADKLFSGQPRSIRNCRVGDVDADGDWDLLVTTSGGMTWYFNDGGNKNHWIDIALRASGTVQFPNHRVNVHGVGSLLELRNGSIYQPRIVTGDTTHFGLGSYERADTLRVLWTNGIPSNIIQPAANQPIVESQRLLGSCPYLYTWTGSNYEFFTDLLWAAPIGLQFADGVTATPREWEYLKIPGDRLVPHDGEYRLSITEELWEAAYFDQVRLLAIDHPVDVDIYSNEKVGPAAIAEYKIHTVRKPRLPVSAVDQRGRDVLPSIRKRDDDFTKTFDRRVMQGLTEEHFIELDLGKLDLGKMDLGKMDLGKLDLGKLDSPKQITLFVTGWMRPTDTSLNVGLSQNPDVPGPSPPAIWVPDENGRWTKTIPYMGFPGGKTKTIAVDLSKAFLTNDYRMRIVTTMELCWDAIFFSVDEDAAEVKSTPLKLLSADLHERGFSRLVPHPQHGPEDYDYDDISTEPLWPPMDGNFTRFGDVTELLKTSDDRLVILGAGDEMLLRFALPSASVPQGWVRDFIIHNVGWDKDANLNTIYGQTVEPLPFRAMNGYPDLDGRQYPDSPAHREYLKTYQTRKQNRFRYWKHVPRSRIQNQTVIDYP